jgi:hypothetical protein
MTEKRGMSHLSASHSHCVNYFDLSSAEWPLKRRVKGGGAGYALRGDPDYGNLFMGFQHLSSRVTTLWKRRV